MKRAILPVLMVSLLTTSAFAKVQRAVDRCLDKATSTMAINRCVESDLHRKDVLLNKEYQSLLGQLKADTSEEGIEILRRVVVAERAWMDFRDTSCDLDGIEMLNGTGETMMVLGCKSKMTSERTAILKGLEKSIVHPDLEEGDISK